MNDRLPSHEPEVPIEPPNEVVERKKPSATIGEIVMLTVAPLDPALQEALQTILKARDAGRHIHGPYLW